MEKNLIIFESYCRNKYFLFGLKKERENPFNQKAIKCRCTLLCEERYTFYRSRVGKKEKEIK